ncbi:MAG: CPBP family glutamic-type intramembrane protease [Promethearchaeota archaeon]|jgi:hypothetical protein
MKSEKLSLYNIAKYSNYELLIDSLILTNQLGAWEEKKKNKRSIKIKVIRTKVLYAIIFGILPIFPLLGYFEISDLLLYAPISIEIIIFHGVLYFGLFFILQFINFFLMGMLETGMIMSGRIFEWFETLPIPRSKLKKIVFITIFRTFDVPIVVIILGFPIIMLVATSSIIIFFICLGISVLNTFFSLCILILIGGKINRALDVNEINSRRSNLIRLLSIFSYVVIILGSIYLIQWASSSIDIFFRMFLNVRNPNTTNMILSAIPFPLNPSYLILNLIVFDRVPSGLWVSSLVGLIIFGIITYWVFTKSMNQLEKLTFSRFRSPKESKISDQTKKAIRVKIKSISPFKAFLRKDLMIISHDLKTFMTIITTVILSFIYSFYYNIGNIGQVVPLENLIYMNLIGMLLFHPILSGMLVYSIFSIEDSGQSVITSLPIISRDLANAKLLFIFTIQTIAMFLPILMYIPDQKFTQMLVVTLIGSPFVWMFLILIFELRINFFGKKRNYYTLEVVKPENALVKWTLIISIEYIISFWITSFIITFYMFNNSTVLTTFLALTAIAGMGIVIQIYRKMLPKISVIEELSKDHRQFIIPTRFSGHHYKSIVVVLILYYLTTMFSRYLIGLIFWGPMGGPNWTSLALSYFLNLVLYNIGSFALFFVLIPKVLGIPYGRQRITQFLKSIKASWLKPLIKYFLWGFILAIGLLIFFTSTNLVFFGDLYYQIWMRYEYFLLIIYSSEVIWQEVVFRGITLTILQENRSKKKAIFLNTLISSAFNFVMLLFSVSNPFTSFFPSLFFMIIVNILISAFLSYLSIKVNSILPGIIFQITLFLLGIPISLAWFVSISY